MSKYLLTLPEISDGQDFARDSFWWTYRERFTIPMKFRRKVRRTAFEWFDREENAARQPIFREMPPKVPQPNAGKDGANGWTPRNS